MYKIHATYNGDDFEGAKLYRVCVSGLHYPPPSPPPASACWLINSSGGGGFGTFFKTIWRFLELCLAPLVASTWQH